MFQMANVTGLPRIESGKKGEGKKGFKIDSSNTDGLKKTELND